MDDNGDRDTSFAMLDMDPKTGEFTVSWGSGWIGLSCVESGWIVLA